MFNPLANNKEFFHKQNFSNIQRENCIQAFNDRNKSRVGNEKVASKNMHNMKIFCFFLVCNYGVAYLYDLKHHQPNEYSKNCRL